MKCWPVISHHTHTHTGERERERAHVDVRFHVVLLAANKSTLRSVCQKFACGCPSVCIYICPCGARPCVCEWCVVRAYVCEWWWWWCVRACVQDPHMCACEWCVRAWCVCKCVRTGSAHVCAMCFNAVRTHAHTPRDMSTQPRSHATTTTSTAHTRAAYQMRENM